MFSAQSMPCVIRLGIGMDFIIVLIHIFLVVYTVVIQMGNWGSNFSIKSVLNLFLCHRTNQAKCLNIQLVNYEEKRIVPGKLKSKLKPFDIVHTIVSLGIRVVPVHGNSLSLVLVGQVHFIRFLNFSSL